jgi:hypothetical protein
LLTPEKVVRILVDAGADINAEEERYGNALWAASSGGYDKVVMKKRLGNWSVMNFPGQRYHDALQRASDAHEKVMKILVDAGADINAQG